MRQENEQGGERNEAPNATIHPKEEELGHQNLHGLIQNPIPYSQIAENPEHSTQLMFPSVMSYPFVENATLYYFQPLVFMPTQTGLF